MMPLNRDAQLDNIYIIGVDTETCKGPPITMQFFGDFCPAKGVIKFIKNNKITEIFLNTLSELIDGKPCQIMLVGFNLKFDMPGLFADRHDDLLLGEFEFQQNGWHVKGVYDTVFFATLTKRNITVNLIDGALFYTGTNLAKMAKIICPHLPKLEAPAGLGTKVFTAKDREFLEYAIRDAEIAYHLGKKILDWHNLYKVSLCVSSPHLASKIFLKKFLKFPIELPPKHIVMASLSSYHGGKNNLGKDPGFYKKVYSLDIVSAYPAAMRIMPSFYRLDLYKKYITTNFKKLVPQFGVYKVSGNAKLSPWPILYNKDFCPVSGHFINLWITGFELNQALMSNHATFTAIEGYYYDAEKDKAHSPLKDYSEYFFHKKATAKSPEETLFFKILLNALYGKFIQSREETIANVSPFDLIGDDDQIKPVKRIVAGGLFNPFIATLITGCVRAQIHKIELKYEAIHTATDGIFTQKKPDKDTLSTEIGGLKQDGKGDLLLVRNKCYILYTDQKGYNDHMRHHPDKPLLPSGVYPDKWILKYATHAYYGKILDFEKMVTEGRTKYEVVKVNQLRESYRRGLVPNKFEKREVTFNYKGSKNAT